MSLAKGTRLGDWTVQTPLGAGGMGSVYRCHSVLAKDVLAAVKVLKASNLGDIEKRFVQELRTLAALKHPNIVAVHGGGRHEELDLLYMAMELVDGEDLSDRLARGPMGVEETLNVFGPVCHALAYAHQNNIAHRDIKPANIMVRSDGTPMVVDFGIAVSAGQTRMTQEGSIPGTMAYMPPEVFSGGISEPRSADAYALGVLMWECLTGTEPFMPKTDSSPQQHFAQVMGMKLRSDALEISEDAPEALRDVIRKMTEPEPEDRLSDLEQVSKQLAKAGAPTGPALPGWSQSQPIMKTAPAKKRSWIGLGLTGVLSAGCALAATSLLGITAVAGVWAWGGFTPATVVVRPSVDLHETVAEANLALQRDEFSRARRLAGFALDDHPTDPGANLTYGITLLASGDILLARPYLCAAVDEGLENTVPGHSTGELTCVRGEGAKAPLTPGLSIPQLDLSSQLAQLDGTPAAPPSEVEAVAEMAEDTGSPAAPAPPSRKAAPTAARAEQLPLSAPPSNSASSSPTISKTSPSPISPPGDIAGISDSAGGSGIGVRSTPKPRAAISTSTRTVVDDVSGTLDSSAVKSVVKRRTPSLKTCYERLLRSDPTLEGRVSVSFIIASTGRVIGIEVHGSGDLASAMKKNGCLSSVIRRWRFPSSDGDTDIELSLSFAPN